MSGFSGGTRTSGGPGGTPDDASATVKGITKLATAPAVAANPIAAGDNDPRLTDARAPTAHTHDDRYYTEAETDTLIAGRASDAELSSHEADTTAIHGIANTANLILEGDSRLTDARAPTAHNHDASYQPLDADLTAIAALAGQTAYGRSFLALADAAAARTLIGAAAASHTHAQADVTNLTTDLGNKQPLDADLTTIAGLTATTDSIIQSKSSAWAVRTPAQFKVDLALVKADVGLGSVDNTQQQPLDADLTAIAALTTTAFGRGFLDLADAAAGRTKIAAASLVSTKVPTSELGTGTANSTSFLRGDQTWAVPTGGSSPTLEQVQLMRDFPPLSGATVTTPVRTLTPTGLGATTARVFPFLIPGSITVNQVLMQTVGVVANGIILGIFNAAGTQLWTSGAQSTVSGNMAVTTSLPVSLTAGQHYFAVTNNNVVSATAAYQTTPAFTAATVPRWGTVAATLGAMPASLTPSGITETVGGFMAYVVLSNWTT